MKGVRGPREHSAQSISPSFPISSSQSSHVCQPHLCLQTPFLGLLLSQGPSPGVRSARPCLPLSLPVPWPCHLPMARLLPPLASPRPRVGARGWMCCCWQWVPGGAVWDEELLLGATTVAWGLGQATWGPVLRPGAGLAGQEGTGTLRPACLKLAA